MRALLPESCSHTVRIRRDSLVQLSVGLLEHRDLGILAATLLLCLSVFAGRPSAPPEEGTTAPAFSLPDQDGKVVNLEAFRGKWVVLCFYPKDFGAGGTLQAHSFQRDLARYERDNATIIGVSLDPVDSHRIFGTREKLGFRILSDTEHSVADRYGSLMTHEGADYAARNTFVIDPKGVIRKVYLKLRPGSQSAELLAELNALQSKM
jgi:peroxiredoxin Q/BCP